MTHAEEVPKLEQQLDTVEDLVEAGREMLRRKASLRDQEKLAKEIAGETRTLLAQLERREDDPAHDAEKKAPRRDGGERVVGFSGRAIKQARLAKGLTCWGLGKKVGVSGPHISNLEHGRGTPSSELWARLKDILCLG